MAFHNPVIIEDYRGFKICKYTKIQLRLNVTEAKKVIDAKLDHGMSAKAAIIHGIIICTPCIQSKIAPSINSLYAKGH